MSMNNVLWCEEREKDKEARIKKCIDYAVSGKITIDEAYVEIMKVVNDDDLWDCG